MNELQTPSPGSSQLFEQLFGNNPRKADLKKVQLIEEAIRILGKEGTDALTYDRLGQPFKMTRSHVNYYFKTKTDLFAACVRYIIINGQNLTLERMRTAFEKGWKAQLFAVIDGAVDWIEKFPEQVRVYWAFHYFSTLDPSLQKLHAQIRKNGRDRLAAILDAHFKKKRSNEHARDRVLKTLQNIMYGNSLEAMATEPNLDHKKLRSLLKDATLEYIEGYFGTLEGLSK